MQTKSFSSALNILHRESKHWDVPVVSLIANTGKHPFRVLISCILSLRTNDQTTSQAVKRLFAVADSPESLSRLPLSKIQKLIYPVGFYRNKARVISDISKLLLNKYNGRVPSSIDELLTFKGVGRKTANLVVSEGFQKPAICVDVHVHRITNRMGYIKTKDPTESEFALRKKLPKRYWPIINKVLVAFGQHHCRPQSPHCSSCKVKRYCERVGVTKYR